MKARRLKTTMKSGREELGFGEAGRLLIGLRDRRRPEVEKPHINSHEAGQEAPEKWERGGLNDG